MGEMLRIELERELVDAAAERAAEQGLTLDAYVALLLRRTFERPPGEESALVYDHIDDGGLAVVDREFAETDASYERRSALYRGLFGVTLRSGIPSRNRARRAHRRDRR